MSLNYIFWFKKSYFYRFDSPVNGTQIKLIFNVRTVWPVTENLWKKITSREKLSPVVFKKKATN